MSDIHVTHGGVPGAGIDPTKPLESEKSLGDLLSRLTKDFGELVSTQVNLAKVEVKEEVSRAGKGAGILTGAGLVAYLAVALLSFAAAWGLAEVMAEGFAFLIVGGAWAIVAAILYVSGRRELDAVRVPPHTKATLEEDVEWARRQKS
ncbi:MAG TPA: phage holin family protein [Acidimicrobiales bacterium]